MRHNKSGRKLGRTWEHRKALFRNMAKSLLVHGRIRTTESKAKELRKVADKLVTLALRNDLHSRRLAFNVLGDHALVKKLFDEVGPRFAGISGGYTRVVKLGLPRRGDCAPMAFIEFTRSPGEESPAPKAKVKAAPAPAPEVVETPEAAASPETTSEEAEAAASEEGAGEAAVAEAASGETAEEAVAPETPEAEEAASESEQAEDAPQAPSDTASDSAEGTTDATEEPKKE